MMCGMLSLLFTWLINIDLLFTSINQKRLSSIYITSKPYCFVWLLEMDGKFSLSSIISSFQGIASKPNMKFLWSSILSLSVSVILLWLLNGFLILDEVCQTMNISLASVYFYGSARIFISPCCGLPSNFSNLETLWRIMDMWQSPPLSIFNKLQFWWSKSTRKKPLFILTPALSCDVRKATNKWFFRV